MLFRWWFPVCVILGGAIWGVLIYQLGWELTVWLAGTTAVVVVFWAFGLRWAAAAGLAILAGMALRKERKRGYDQREAERAKDALDHIARGTRARNRADVSDERLRDDDGHRRD